MYLVEVAPQRWTVREEKPKGSHRAAHTKFLGTIEFHAFWTYNKNGRRVKDGFWMARFPDHGWRETGWQKVATKKEAIDMLKAHKKS